MKKRYLAQKYFYFVLCVLRVATVPVSAQTDSGTKLGPNVIKNASFENDDADWNISAGTAEVVSDQAHSGKNSLHYINTDKKRYNLFAQKIDVHPGQHLEFSVWVKGQNIVGSKASQGAGIYLQSYDANGKYIRGAFPNTLTGTYGWTRIEGAFDVPANEDTTSVGLYLRKGVTGTVWFDDVEVHAQAPVPALSFLQLYPNYRGLVKQGDETPWKFVVRFSNQSVSKDSPVKVTNTLVDNKGKVLFNESSEASIIDQSAEITIAAPANLDVGNYIWKQTVTDANGKVILKNQRSIQVMKKMPKVYIDAQGFTVVNGKRFFPLGMYLGPTGDEHLQRISEGGFNTILCYSYGARNDPEAYLKRAANHHLKVIYSLKDMYPGKHGYTENAYDVAAEYVKRVRDNPNLLAWYINDELKSGWMPKLGKMYKQVVELDPNHPAFQALNDIKDMEKYFDVTDVLGSDPYPVGSADLARTSNTTRVTMSAAHGAKGVWMVPQSMDWAVYHKERKSHPPSRDEMRNQAYQAIINGATGIIFYSYYDMMYEKYPRGESTKNMELFNKRWADAAGMAHEIGNIIPAILNGSKVPLALPSDAQVEAGALEYKNEFLIMLANPYYQEKNITFALPQGWKIKDADQGEIKSTFTNGRVTFTLPSIGSGVFHLERVLY